MWIPTSPKLAVWFILPVGFLSPSLPPPRLIFWICFRRRVNHWDVNPDFSFTLDLMDEWMLNSSRFPRRGPTHTGRDVDSQGSQEFVFFVVFTTTSPCLFVCLFVVHRSLQIHEETGVSHTRWLEEQRGQEGADGLGGPLRYPDPCIFWLHADMAGVFPLPGPVATGALGAAWFNVSWTAGV